MAKSNKLTVSVIKQAHSKKFTQKKLTLVIDGKNYPILLDEAFATTKIRRLIDKLLNIYKEFYKIEHIFDLNLYTYYLLIEFFTDMELESNSYEEAIAIMKQFDDLEILDTIINSFSQDEVNKINKYIKVAEENLNKLKENPEALKQYEDILKIVQEEIDKVEAEEPEEGDSIE